METLPRWNKDERTAPPFNVVNCDSSSGFPVHNALEVPSSLEPECTMFRRNFHVAARATLINPGPPPPSQVYQNIPNVFKSLEDVTAATFEADRPPSHLLSPSFTLSLSPHAPYHRFFGHANLDERLSTPPFKRQKDPISGQGRVLHTRLEVPGDAADATEGLGHGTSGVEVGLLQPTGHLMSMEAVDPFILSHFFIPSRIPVMVICPPRGMISRL